MLAHEPKIFTHEFGGKRCLVTGGTRISAKLLRQGCVVIADAVRQRLGGIDIVVDVVGGSPAQRSVQRSKPQRHSCCTGFSRLGRDRSSCGPGQRAGREQGQ